MSEAVATLKKMLLLIGVIAAYCLLRMPEVKLVGFGGVICTLFLPVMSLLLVHDFSLRIAERGTQKFFLMAIAWLICFFVVIREIKYNGLLEAGEAVRFLWYSYYIPILMIPLLSFSAAQLIGGHPREIPRGFWWKLSVTILLILFVFTNDIHQQVFRFQPQMVDWETDYSYGWGYVAVTIWEYGCYLAALVTMVKKSRLVAARRFSFLAVTPFLLGVLLLLVTRSTGGLRVWGYLLLGVPEIICCSIALFWQTSISLGLIPTNESYGRWMKKISLPVWITNTQGAVLYQSEQAGPIAAQSTEMEKEILLDENTILHRQVIAGGYGFWQEDISEMNRVNAYLQDLREQLAEETELTKLENRRKEEQERIDRRNEVYDRIARKSAVQFQKIRTLAILAEQEGDQQKRKEYADQICFLGAYVKRSSNLMLLSQDKEEISTGELGYSIAESLYYLGLAGRNYRFGENADVILPAGQVIGIYDLTEEILERLYEELSGVYVTFVCGEEWTLRLILEAKRDQEEAYREEDWWDLRERAAAEGIEVQMFAEENCIYARLSVREEAAV